MALLQKAYLGATPLFRNEDWFEDDAPLIVDASAAVNVTANTAAHTMGSWSELVASTTADASFICVLVSGISASSINTATLLSLATGASGSEAAFASNIAVGGVNGDSSSLVGCVFGFPIKLASGTRISARIQSVVTGGKTASVRIFTMNAGDYATAPTSVDVIGTSTANSEGTSFSGASGTWVEAIASTASAYRAITVVPSCHSANTNTAASTWTYTVGVGASGSEVAFGSGQASVDLAERLSSRAPFNYLFGRSIPAGSRLAVRHTLPASPTTIGFTLIGIP